MASTSETVVTGIVSVALGVVSLAALSVIFSDKSKTATVINAGSGGLATNVLAAVSPITGNAPMIQTASAF